MSPGSTANPSWLRALECSELVQIRNLFRGTEKRRFATFGVSHRAPPTKPPPEKSRHNAPRERVSPHGPGARSLRASVNAHDRDREAPRPGVRLRRPRARHQRPDHGDPPQQAPQHLRDEPQRGRRDARAGDGRRRRHGHRRGAGRDQVQRRRPPQPLHLLGEPRAALRGRRRAADRSARAASFRARVLPRNRRSPQARSPRRSTRSSAASTR